MPASPLVESCENAPSVSCARQHNNSDNPDNPLHNPSPPQANESIQNTFNHFVFEAELRLFEEEGISLQVRTESSGCNLYVCPPP